VATLAPLRRPLALGALALAALAAPALRIAQRPAPRAQAARHPLLAPEARRALERLPRGSVVLTDLWSADFLPAVGGHYVVAGITWHTASTRDQLAARDFFADPYQGSGEALDLLRRRQVDYVALVEWAGSDLDWPGYGSGFLPDSSRALLAANPSVFRPRAKAFRLELWEVARPLPERLAGKDRSPPLRRAPESPPLVALGDYDVVGATVEGGLVRVELRARRATRGAPLVAALVLPAGRVEHSALGRIARVLRGERLGYAEGRMAGAVRIDNRFYAPRRIAAGEGIEVVLSPRPAPGPGRDLYVGDAEALPPFPSPLAPALAESFARVAGAGDASRPAATRAR
jgi:hypothetical protein